MDLVNLFSARATDTRYKFLNKEHRNNFCRDTFLRCGHVSQNSIWPPTAIVNCSHIFLPISFLLTYIIKLYK